MVSLIVNCQHLELISEPRVEESSHSTSTTAKGMHCKILLKLLLNEDKRIEFPEIHQLEYTVTRIVTTIVNEGGGRLVWYAKYRTIGRTLLRANPSWGRCLALIALTKAFKTAGICNKCLISWFNDVLAEVKPFHYDIPDKFLEQREWSNYCWIFVIFHVLVICYFLII